MQKPVRHLVWAGVFAALTAGLVALACLLPEFWFSFYTDVSSLITLVLGTAYSIIPVPFWEIMVVFGVLLFLGCLILAIRKHRLPGLFAILLETATLLIALFMALWGLNHFAPPIGEELGLEIREYTTKELQEAAAYYAERASALSRQVPRDAAGELVLPELSELSKEGVKAYKTLGEKHERLTNVVPVVKPLMSSSLFANMGISGIYICLTGEAAVSTETYALALPFTICHELGHSLAVAREDEANYLAFLACRSAEDRIFQYSGYYNAFRYCYNALKDEDSTSAERLWDLCSDEMRRDSRSHTAHNKQYEGKLQETARAVNDAYLKTFSEEGVKSYGLVADYLIAEYLKSK